MLDAPRLPASLPRNLTEAEVDALLAASRAKAGLPGLLAHALQLRAMLMCPGDGVRQLIGTARLDDETLPLIFDQVRRRGVGGGEDGQAAGHGLQKDLAEALCDGGKDEEVGLLVCLDKIFRRDGRTNGDAIFQMLEETEIINDPAADGQVEIEIGQQVQSFQEVAKTFALVDAADKE